MGFTRDATCRPSCSPCRSERCRLLPLRALPLGCSHPPPGPGMTFGVSASFLSQLNEQTSVRLVRPPREEGAASPPPPRWSLSVSLSCHGDPTHWTPHFQVCCHGRVCGCPSLPSRAPAEKQWPEATFHTPRDAIWAAACLVSSRGHGPGAPGLTSALAAVSSARSLCPPLGSLCSCHRNKCLSGTLVWPPHPILGLAVRLSHGLQALEPRSVHTPAV